MQCGWLPAAGTHADLEQDVVRRLLGIFDENVKIAIFIEDACIQQLIFHVVPVTSLVRLDQIIVRIRRLRILVQILHVGMRGRTVEVEVVLLYVFSVVALAIRQAEQTFFENGVFAIPKGDAEAQQLHIVADAGETIFTPVIGARSGLVVSEIVPRISILAVIFANGSPLPLTQVGSPLSPGLFAGAN